MSFVSRLHGSRWCQLRQYRRQSDGVRGLFTAQALSRGDVVFAVPLRYCCLTHVDIGSDPTRSNTELLTAWKLRRVNRGCCLFPELWPWLCRLSPDAPSDRVALAASASTPVYSCTSRVEGDSNGTGSRPSVVSLSLSPVEAALATCIALRYFYSAALNLSVATRLTLGLHPTPHELADTFVRNLPLEDYINYGVETLYGGDMGHEADAHSCLEQLASNLRDAVLMHASANEYHLLDRDAALFDAVLLASLYVVRARVLPVPLLGRSGESADRLIRVFAPGVEALNHSHLPSVAVAVAPAMSMLIGKATRPLRIREEMTLDYEAGVSLSKNQQKRFRSGGNLRHSSLSGGDCVFEMEGSHSLRFLMKMAE